MHLSPTQVFRSSLPNPIAQFQLFDQKEGSQFSNHIASLHLQDVSDVIALEKRRICGATLSESLLNIGAADDPLRTLTSEEPREEGVGSTSVVLSVCGP